MIPLCLSTYGIAKTEDLLSRTLKRLGYVAEKAGENGWWKWDETYRASDRRPIGVAARLDRQGALIQSGSRWTTRTNEWSEKVDAALEQRDKQMGELIRRFEKLEAGGTSSPETKI
jgi:hypothetical protein